MGEAKRGKCIQKGGQDGLGQVSERRPEESPLSLGLWM